MTTSDYYRILGDALLDYGRAWDGGTLKERDEASRLIWDIVRDREDFHTREAELAASKLYDAASDMGAAFREAA